MAKLKTAPIKKVDAVIIGGGPAGLLSAHYLKKFGVKSVVLERHKVGQSWRDMKKGMVMLSPAAAAHDLTSLTYENPIWSMVNLNGPFATREEFLTYLRLFVKENKLSVRENSSVQRIERDGNRFNVQMEKRRVYSAKIVVVATGVIGNPCLPDIPGLEGNQKVVHSRDYKGFEQYRGKKVLIVGGGNSGAELTIELSGISSVTLATRSKLKYFSKTRDLSHIRGLSESFLKELIDFHIVALKERIEVERLEGGRAFFADGSEGDFDEIIFATGYCANLPKLSGMKVKTTKAGYPKVTSACQSVSVEGLFFTGPLAHSKRYCSFIHCFRPMIEPMALEIADLLGR